MKEERGRREGEKMKGRRGRRNRRKKSKKPKRKREGIGKGREKKEKMVHGWKTNISMFTYAQ